MVCHPMDAFCERKKQVSDRIDGQTLYYMNSVSHWSISSARSNRYQSTHNHVCLSQFLAIWAVPFTALLCQYDRFASFFSISSRA